jgi:hypothetical protein
LKRFSHAIGVIEPARIGNPFQWGPCILKHGSSGTHAGVLDKFCGWDLCVTREDTGEIPKAHPGNGGQSAGRQIPLQVVQYILLNLRYQ